VRKDASVPHYYLFRKKEAWVFKTRGGGSCFFFPEEMKIPGLLSKEADEPCHGVRKNAEANIEKN